ncbi:MAG: FAD-binding protein, partial [Odoribacter sp.]|nr:FAD-binding protein [Odoribacter sp.]
MYKEIQVRIRPEEAGNEGKLKRLASGMLHIREERVVCVEVLRRSIDARQREVLFNLTLGVHVDVYEEREKAFIPAYREVGDGEAVVVVGAGPAGLFAALRLIERGFKPIVLERGKAVEDRKKDLNRLYKTGCVDEDSNFGFGEGGAGTFSDGKLFTRSKKRGDVRRIMEILVFHGAHPGILTDAHPHVGTDKLPGVIARIRETIKRYGGEVHF